jgi:two-component system, chemotaxis family, sensor kinase CheA
VEALDEIVHEFLVESHENLDQLDSDLVALESSPGSRDLLGSVFRTIHTIKGTSGFLAFSSLESLTHIGENLLVELRDGKRVMDQVTADALLRMVDTVRDLLGQIERTGSDADIDVAGVLGQLEQVLASEPGAAPAQSAESVPEPEAEPTAESASEPEPEPTAESAPEPEPEPVSEPQAEPAPKKVSKVRRKPRSKDAPAPEAGQSADPASEGDQTADSVKPEPATPAPAAEVPHPHEPSEPLAAAEPETSSRGSASSTDTIRVDVEMLDALMRQVSELVLARNAISRIAEGGEIELARASQRLNLVASELQEGVMKTRMQPIEHVWSKVPRMVRDLAASCQRKVRLEMVGGDTELDRSLLEAVKDPLTHLIRNAVDHGIEDPAVRTAAGKPEQGVLSLRAYHAGGQVVVEVVDDGKGINPEAIGKIAMDRGLRTAAEIEAMAPADLLQLLFLPGLSTAEKVTNVSGRGVGMDVVRTKIEAIGGTVDVDSVLGRGTTWRLRIPLTLAIMPAVTVSCDGRTYAIPQVSLLELVALDDAGETAVEYVRSAPVYRLRGDLLPLLDLREVFGRPPRNDDRAVIAVLQTDTVRFGLLVDQVLNTEEIVVKPLSSRLKSIGLYAGATLMGDGDVALILDVQGLARRNISSDTVERARAARTEDESVGDVDQVLVAGIGDGRRVAIPLSEVTRLERLPADTVERIGSREVLQYRGAITPVVRLSGVLGAMSVESDEVVVVVHSRGDRTVAILVDEIIDIVDDHASQHSGLADHGLIGATVVGERVTELLDLTAALAAADSSFDDDAFGLVEV